MSYKRQNLSPACGTARPCRYLLAFYLFFYHKKAINALYQLALGVAGHQSTTQRCGNATKYFTNGTSKLAGLFSKLSF